MTVTVCHPVAPSGIVRVIGSGWVASFLAIIGRANVGKSALFNRIIGDEEAIVSEEAGTTRDRHFSKAEWNGRAFWLVDTGGLSDEPNAPMDREIRQQVATAVIGQ